MQPSPPQPQTTTDAVGATTATVGAGTGTRRGSRFAMRVRRGLGLGVHAVLSARTATGRTPSRAARIVRGMEQKAATLAGTTAPSLVATLTTSSPGGTVPHGHATTAAATAMTTGPVTGANNGNASSLLSTGAARLTAAVRVDGAGAGLRTRPRAAAERSVPQPHGAVDSAARVSTAAVANRRYTTGRSVEQGGDGATHTSVSHPRSLADGGVHVGAPGVSDGVGPGLAPPTRGHIPTRPKHAATPTRRRAGDQTQTQRRGTLLRHRASFLVAHRRHSLRVVPHADGALRPGPHASTPTAPRDDTAPAAVGGRGNVLPRRPSGVRTRMRTTSTTTRVATAATGVNGGGGGKQAREQPMTATPAVLRMMRSQLRRRQSYSSQLSVL